MPPVAGGVISKLVYSNTIGDYKVFFSLYFDTKEEEFGFSKGIHKVGPLIVKEPGEYQPLGTWRQSLVKWFSINIDVNDVNVMYNIKDQYYIQNFMQGLKKELEENINKMLKSRDVLGIGDIKINFTKPYP